MEVKVVIMVVACDGGSNAGNHQSKLISHDVDFENIKIVT